MRAAATPIGVGRGVDPDSSFLIRSGFRKPHTAAGLSVVMDRRDLFLYTDATRIPVGASGGNAMRRACFVLLALSVAEAGYAQATYDMLLKGGHVIDGRNSSMPSRRRHQRRQDRRRDSPTSRHAGREDHRRLRASTSCQVSSTSTSTCTPARSELFARVPQRPSGRLHAGKLHDAVADAGSSGWRNFEDFKKRIIDKSSTRVFAFLNIVGNGMGGGQIREQTSRTWRQSRPAKWH